MLAANTARLLFAALAPVVLAVSAAAQASPPAPGAALAAQADSALTGATPLTSVRLTGTAVWTAGSSTDSGTIVLEAAGPESSRVDLELAGGSRVQVRAPIDMRAAAPPGGAEQAAGSLATEAGEASGAVRRRKLGDAFTPAVWFFPALALEAAESPAAVVTDLGSVTVDGAPADRLRLARTLPHQMPAITAALAKLSRADFDLDPSTRLPVALRFVRHPGGVVNRNPVRVQIRYADWRPVAGVEVPYHIERWVNGDRQIVIDVTGAEINPALAAGEFQLGGAQ